MKSKAKQANQLKPVPLDKPIPLDLQTLTPVTKPKKTWGPIAQVNAQPIDLQQFESKSTAKKTQAVSAKKTTSNQEVNRDDCIDKDAEVESLLNSASKGSIRAILVSRRAALYSCASSKYSFSFSSSIFWTFSSYTLISPSAALSLT